MDLFHNLSFEELDEYEAQTASADSAEVDVSGVERLLLVIRHGAWTDGTHDFAVEHSDVSGSGFAAVDAEDLLPEGATKFAQVGDATADDSYQQVEYRGGKRYVRVAATLASTTTGALWGIFAVKGEPRHVGQPA